MHAQGRDGDADLGGEGGLAEARRLADRGVPVTVHSTPT